MYIKQTVCALLILGSTALLTSCAGDHVVQNVYEPAYVDRNLTRLLGFPEASFQLNLPNLKPRRTRFQIFDDEVIITPRVENVGNARSGPFNVHVGVQLIDNNGQAHPAQDLGHNPWSPLDNSRDRTLGHTPSISVEGLPRPITLIIMVSVDIPTATGGQVWESNEADNIRTDETTIF